MQEILKVTDEVADTESTVLITGETGTGKDLLARYVHEHSRRNGHKMVVVNCAALPESLLESELFGYERGAYTGALNTGKAGLIQEANGGTLFLDEVNSMPLSAQGKLLRVLEDGKVKRLGGLKEESVNFRLIAATNQDLKRCIANGTFRADLYYRLSVVLLDIPPLRERKADIIPLALRFLDYYCKRYEREKTFSPSVFHELLEYDWPGNVRELKNIIERIVVTSSASTVEIKQLPSGMWKIFHEKTAQPIEVLLNWEIIYQSNPDQFSLQNYLDICEGQLIESVLRRSGSTREAAKILKINQSNVVRRSQKYRKDK